MAMTLERTIRNAVTGGVLKVAAFNRKRLKAPAGGHPYLTGIHRPMDEELTLEALEVDGSIPQALDGRYLRIGPNPVTAPDPGSYHWFAGDGMVHGLRLKDGAAHWYRNRWVRSNAVSDSLGEPRKPGDRNPRTDTVNTNIVAMGGRTIALVEAGGKPVEMDAELHTVRHDPLDGMTKGFSAHPHRDPSNGEMHAICYEATIPDRVWHKVVDAQGRVIREEPVPVRDGPSIHDCQITRNYVLIMDLPATFSLKRLMAGYAFPYDWNPGHGARVGLMPRRGTADDIMWCELEEPCYVYHPANAFEDEDGTVIMDVVVHQSTYEESPHGPGGRWARFERWSMSPAGGPVMRRILDDRAQEFPRYDERRSCQPYRYAYTMELGTDESGAFVATGQRLFKHDLETGDRQARDFGAGRHPGEFVFVPRDPDTTDSLAEDDGWLVGLVVDGTAGTTELHILNADDFEGPSQAVIYLPHRIPPGFHGNWIPTA